MAAVRACYQERLAADSRRGSPQGRFVVGWSVGPLGEVYDARIAKAAFGDPEVQRCILGVIRGLRFNPPVDGWQVIHYPFNLSSR